MGHDGERGLLSDQLQPPGRVALALSYDGSGYYGWQRQDGTGVPSVQGALEQALARVAAAPVSVQCAGRTDAGVHASHQLVHFDPPVQRSEKAWVMGGNAHLPGDIAIHWARPVPADFHARYAAEARRYRYIIHNHALRPVHLRRLVTRHERPLDAALMHREAQALLGERDFSAFRAAGCQSRSPMRNVHFVEVWRRAGFVIIDIQANAFLHHMVRNIAGVLMAVGDGSAEPGWAAQVLAGRDRTRGGVTARPDGLYLVDVRYPQSFGLPDSPLGPVFLPA